MSEGLQGRKRDLKKGFIWGGGGSMLTYSYSSNLKKTRAIEGERGSFSAERMRHNNIGEGGFWGLGEGVAGRVWENNIINTKLEETQLKVCQLR